MRRPPGGLGIGARVGTGDREPGAGDRGAGGRGPGARPGAPARGPPAPRRVAAAYRPWPVPQRQPSKAVGLYLLGVSSGRVNFRVAPHFRRPPLSREDGGQSRDGGVAVATAQPRGAAASVSHRLCARRGAGARLCLRGAGSLWGFAEANTSPGKVKGRQPAESLEQPTPAGRGCWAPAPPTPESSLTTMPREPFPPWKYPV